jgi:ankyrin repeat protein
MLAVAKIKRIPLINTNAEGRHLENNANPNIKVSLGNPLMQACQKNNFVAVKLLIERGDNVNFANITKNTPIMYTSDLKIVNYLVSKGADVNASDRYQETVLMSFLNKDIPVDEKIKIMSFLIEHGADVNAVANQDEFEVGQTILDIAIFQKYPKELIDFLRKHGAKTAEELKQEKNPESKN